MDRLGIEKVAVAIDNIRVAICDPKSFDPSYIPMEQDEEQENLHNEDEPLSYNDNDEEKN